MASILSETWRVKFKTQASAWSCSPKVLSFLVTGGHRHSLTLILFIIAGACRAQCASWGQRTTLWSQFSPSKPYVGSRDWTQVPTLSQQVTFTRWATLLALPLAFRCKMSARKSCFLPSWPPWCVCFCAPFFFSFFLLWWLERSPLNT